MLNPIDLGPLDWSTPSGIVATVTAAANALLAGRLDPSRARALAEMASRVLAALSDQLLEERLRAIEQQLRELEAQDASEE